MRILLLTARYLPHVGGLEKVVHNIIWQFRANGHAVLIVTNRYPRQLPAREYVDDMLVRRILFALPTRADFTLQRAGRFGAGLALLPYSAARLALIVQAYRPDVINLHYLGSPTLFWWLTQLVWPIQTVISLHGGDVFGVPHQSHLHYWLFRTATRTGGAVTACSQHLLTQAIALEPSITEKGHVIHNGVHLDQFVTARPHKRSRRYILAVGQLVNHKGFDILIQAFSRIATDHPTVDLIIAGSGPEYEQLQRLISESQLNERVELMGRQTPLEIASLMRGSCFVAMPSRAEAFGLVALEAMAAGRPVLATPIGGVPEFAGTTINRLVPLATELWAEALSDLLAQYTAGQSSTENQQVAAAYSWEEVADRYLAVLRSVAHNQFRTDINEGVTAL